MLKALTKGGGVQNYGYHANIILEQAGWGRAELPLFYPSLLQVVIDYKSHKFEGKKGEILRGLMIEMDFEGVGGVWKLIKLELKNIPYKADFYDLEMHHTTQYGYQVSAPLGLCFSCNQPGRLDHQSLTVCNLERKKS